MSLKESCLVLLRVFISRMFQLILFIVLCFYILKISQGCPLGLAVGPICMQLSAC